MNIILITPAARLAKNGNRTTAVRWARILRELGHRVRVDVEWDGRAADLMVAIHAWRSADSALRFRERYPVRPLIVLLAGTDIYRFQKSHRQATHRSMEIADALACLHELVHRAIPAKFAAKLHVVHQSAPPLTAPRKPSMRHFDICVVGHLREEKDSLRTAFAVRNLPAESKIRVLHLGKAHNQDWADKARREMATNARYHWLGEVPGWRVRREFAKTHLMVLSSVMEGGANVISEAVAAGVPVIASDIEGSVGLLGEDYAGYYPVENTDALRAMLLRAESDASFVERLGDQCAAKRPLFTPERETAEWRALLESLQ
ncbi:MAG: selenoneine biosynthesis selenosugar synthase SenB [Proteobacteria bacterium]|nr:selenoneine biosynthesis selenosugar synthase SenB [Pseudomonadota bacterium]